MNIFKSLKSRIVFASAFSIILIAVTVVTASQLTRDETESRYQGEAFKGKRILWQQLIKGQLDTMRSELFSFTRNSSALVALSEGKKRKVSDLFQPTFNRLKASRIIDGMQILSVDGNPVFIKPDGVGQVLASGVAKTAITTGKITTGIEQDTNGRLNVVFALPLYSTPGKVLGVGIYTRTLQSIIAKFKQSEGSDVYIVNADKKLVFSTNKNLFSNIKPVIPQLGDSRYAIYKFNKHAYSVLSQPVKDARGKALAHLINISEYTASYTKQNNIQLYSGIVAISIFIFILLALNWYIRRALLPLDDVQGALKSVSGGDLTVNIENNGADDEVGQMLSSVSAMVDRLRHMISEITSSTSTMSNFSSEMHDISELTNEGINKQQLQIDQVATAMSEMTSTVQGVAMHAQEAADSATQADNEAEQGRQVVGKTLTSINSLAVEIENAATTIKKVETNSIQIGTVLDVIKSIAEQTNLLALNAAIEAARAGEQGRGFAVVADEVRTLASRTQESTQEIQEMIEQLQSGSQEAVTVMTSSQEMAKITVEHATSAGSSLESITSKVKSINQMNFQIAAAAEEQSSVSEEINQNIVEISQIAEQSVGGAQQTASASNKLSGLSQELKDLVTQFKV